ncbi:MAG: Gp15 family bacteriophage protein [Anaerorhabdus sp.]|uniref:Gp15 family bacteriophage protein n=1 Tax=Anaerorhabdus sp. TaxID=1872524 RepID=UPI002FC73D6F
MSFNFLLDEYPTQIVINEVVYEIDTDFKSVLRIIQLLDDNIFSDEEKIVNSVFMFYREKIPKNMNIAYLEMMNFISIFNEKKSGNEDKTRIIDYDIDSGLIYTAFIQCYQIDLSFNKMHWFKFCCLLENLSDSKPSLMHIMEIRTLEIDENYSSKQKSKLRKLKRKYSLEKQEDICNSFANSFFLGVKGGTKENDNPKTNNSI